MADKTRILQVAPLLLKIHHYINTSLQPINLEKEHSTLKYNQKIVYQKQIDNLDSILLLLKETE
jgi:hypothetical protein